MEKLIENGKQMGLEGDALQKFVLEQQAIEREHEREQQAIEREHEREQQAIEREHELEQQARERDERAAKGEHEKILKEAELKIASLNASQMSFPGQGYTENL